MLLDVQSVKDYLQLTGVEDDARVLLACRQAEQAAAKWCGRDQFEHKWYARSENLPQNRTRLIAPVRPFSGIPAVCYDDLGFAFTSSDVTTGTPGTINFVNHGLASGDGPFRVVSQGDGAGVPQGLDSGIDYWIVRVNEDSLRLATSEANALAGTVLTITDAPIGVMSRLIGPCLARDEIRFDPDTGVISAFDITFPIGPITYIYRAGVCTNGDDAPDDLFGALVEQAAYRFRQGGNVGRLGIARSEKPAGVVDTYVVAEWAPGVLAMLEGYKVHNL